VDNQSIENHAHTSSHHVTAPHCNLRGRKSGVRPQRLSSDGQANPASRRPVHTDVYRHARDRAGGTQSNFRTSGKRKRSEQLINKKVINVTAL
jgi:hypothetical protein